MEFGNGPKVPWDTWFVLNNRRTWETMFILETLGPFSPRNHGLGPFATMNHVLGPLGLGNHVSLGNVGPFAFGNHIFPKKYPTIPQLIILLFFLNVTHDKNLSCNVF